MLAIFLLVTAFAGLTAKPTVSHSESCPTGQVASVSKYAGSVCMAKPNKAGKAVQSTVTGCLIGAFGGTIGSLLGGCATGAVSAI